MSASGAAGILSSVLASGARLGLSPGVTGTVVLVVTGTAEGDVTVRLRLDDGRPADGLLGDGPGPDPDLTLTLPAADADGIVAGTLDPSVAFMRGRLKTAGDNRLLLGLLAATAVPGFGAWLAAAVSPHRAPA